MPAQRLTTDRVTVDSFCMGVPFQGRGLADGLARGPSSESDHKSAQPAVVSADTRSMTTHHSPLDEGMRSYQSRTMARSKKGKTRAAAPTTPRGAPAPRIRAGK